MHGHGRVHRGLPGRRGGERDQVLGYAIRTHGQHAEEIPPDPLRPEFLKATTRCWPPSSPTRLRGGRAAGGRPRPDPAAQRQPAGLAGTCGLLGPAADRVFLDNVPVTGHCFAADPFINYVAPARPAGCTPGASTSWPRWGSARPSPPWSCATDAADHRERRIPTNERNPMSASTLNFLDGVRRACTGGSETPLILVGNFEVEDEWARDEVGLPSRRLPRVGRDREPDGRVRAAAGGEGRPRRAEVGPRPGLPGLPRRPRPGPAGHPAGRRAGPGPHGQRRRAALTAPARGPAALGAAGRAAAAARDVGAGGAAVPSDRGERRPPAGPRWSRR